MNREIKESIEQIFEIIGDEKLAKVIAKMFRNLYTALLEEGFTNQEAITIICNFNSNFRI